ncbi:MAG: amidohydrolase family protein, partial [Rhodospirillaceae bacterium]|nr:amidohydrolase family protein [Rhodospirillaceae bacterium]
TPPEATVDSYRKVLDTVGIERCVIVQPSVYGTDNACTLAAMAELGSCCRGVAVVDETVGADEIAAMDGAGVRGVRFNLMFKGGATLGALETVAALIAKHGWHIQLLIAGDVLAEHVDRLRGLPVDLVIDHMGHIPADQCAHHPGFAALLALLAEGWAWVKLSGAYRVTVDGPAYDDVDPVARRLIAAAPDRVVWGTDWPHPAHFGPMPNDGDLLDLAARWCDDDVSLHALLTDNAARLYGF